MKASLDWLNQYLDRPCTAAKAERVLTGNGFPFDGQQPVALTSGKTDVQLDVEITSNRGDCLSHLGLARELSAGSTRALRPPAITLPAAAAPPVAQLTTVANDAPDLCPVYTARVILGVKVGPSPAWLVDRLEAVGLRTVNNVVDVTNFVLLELGQPLHAFDMNLLHGRRIVVRRAKKAEPFVAIDGSKHALTPSMLVIADADRPVAVAGVMGGLESEVSAATTDVLLESARFDPLSIRRTSRALKLASDSSYRYERGVDPRGIELASQRAAQLILELAGGKLAEGVLRAGEPEPAPRTLTLRPERCNALLGTDLSIDEQAQLLARLGLEPHTQDGSIVCAIPTCRLDLQREVDLVEEVGRLHGLNRIATRERIEIQARPVQPEVAARRTLGQSLAAHGYHETVTASFLSPQQAAPFLPADAKPLVVHETQRRAEPVLRPSLLPSLLVCRKANQDLGNTNVRLFEAAGAWTKQADELHESRHLALLIDAEDAQHAVRELRGALEELIEQLGGEAARQALRIEPMAEHATFAVAAELRLGEQWLGVMGLLDAKTRDAFEVKTPVAGAELLLDALIDLYPPRRQVRALPRVPAIERDLSIVVDEPVAWRQVEQAVMQARPALLEGVRFIGTYRGKPIPAGRKSVSFRMVFRAADKTLRHEEVDPQVEQVVQALQQSTNAELRK